MRIMAASYLFCGLSTMISTYFQATEQLMPSMLIQLLRQLLLLIPFMWCLEKLLKITGSGCPFLSPKRQHLFWRSCFFRQAREKRHFVAMQRHSRNQEGETIWRYRLKKGLDPYKQKQYFAFYHRLYGRAAGGKKQLLSHGNILSAMELIPLTEDKSDLREL